MSGPSSIRCDWVVVLARLAVIVPENSSKGEMVDAV
jgi:hypothetical protein